MTGLARWHINAVQATNGTSIIYLPNQKIQGESP